MLSFLDRYRDLAPLLLRLFVGFVLIYGTADNVFSTARMLEFRDFLAANGFPYPLACAYLAPRSSLDAALARRGRALRIP